MSLKKKPPAKAAPKKAPPKAATKPEGKKRPDPSASGSVGPARSTRTNDPAAFDEATPPPKLPTWKARPAERYCTNTRGADGARFIFRELMREGRLPPTAVLLEYVGSTMSNDPLGVFRVMSAGDLVFKFGDKPDQVVPNPHPFGKEGSKVTGGQLGRWRCRVAIGNAKRYETFGIYIPETEWPS